MRNEIKILIAAIVVIIIVLVGAFALGGNKSTQVSITPTPVTITATPTPTPVPIGGGQGSVATPTPAPSIAPTATPTPTPTAEPESGVKLTEFGYWITYPPLGPEKWSDPHPPPASGHENNTVYFDPTSAEVKVPEILAAGSDQEGTPAVIHRNGDLSGTTTVGIYVIPDDNMVYSDSLESDYYIPVELYMTRISETYYQVTFDPGVTERTVYIDVGDIYNNIDSVTAADDITFSGKVKLDIVEVDDGYKIGSDHLFTLTVTNAPITNTVMFDNDNDAYLWTDGSGNPHHTSGIISATNNGTDKIDVTIPVYRVGDPSASLPVTFTTYGRTEAVDMINPCTFASGASEADLKIVIYKNELGYDTSKSDNLGIDIWDGSSSYTVGTPYDFNIECYEPDG